MQVDLILAFNQVAAFKWFWDTPSWGWSYVWAVAFLAAPFVSTWIVRVVTSSNPRPLIDVVNGADGQWSTSKTAVVLWTFAIWFVFLAILFHTQGKGIGDLLLQEEYLVVLGIPAAAAVAAKGIVVSKIESGDVTRETGQPEANVVRGVGQLVSDKEGRTDTMDFQYFGFTLILLGFFALRFFGEPDMGIPDLPDTLLALTGVSAFAYVSKKGVEKDTPPTIRSVVPPSAPPGTPVTIRGVSLASALVPGADVLFGAALADAPTVTVLGRVVELRTVVPATLTPGIVDLAVVAADGRISQAVAFTVL